MRQFRKDPLSDRWVAYAQGREDRPNEFENGGRRRPDARCPFCAGHEQDTPPQVSSYTAKTRRRELEAPARDAAAPWLVRVVPNKYPAFRPTEDTKLQQHGLYTSAGAFGGHEVIIESPRHVASLSQLTDTEALLSLQAYRDRIQAFHQRTGYGYVLVFKNVGPRAGASLEHTHSQVVATAHVPAEIANEVAAVRRLFERHQACFFCRVIADELDHGERLVAKTSRFIAVCPYASRMPYELWVLPRVHSSHFELQDEQALPELALFVRQLIQRLEQVHGRLAYNFFIHTTPFDTSFPPHYHWHIEIFPRLTITAGFEWGTGYYINPVPPEQAAAVLRSCDT